MFVFFRDIKSIIQFETNHGLDANSRLLIHILIGIYLKIGSFPAHRKCRSREELNSVSRLISDIYHKKPGDISFTKIFNSRDTGGDDSDIRLIKYNEFPFLKNNEPIDEDRNKLYAIARKQKYEVLYDEIKQRHYLSKSNIVRINSKELVKSFNSSNYPTTGLLEFFWILINHCKFYHLRQ